MEKSTARASISKTKLALLSTSALLTIAMVGCGGGAGDSGSSDEFPIDVTRIPEDNLVPVEDRRIIPKEEARVFRSDGPYANVLKNCALADSESPCILKTLPYIGQDTNNPSIDDILDRTIVTHDWMAVRFAQLLAHMPPDVLPLFRPVTSIVIGSDVRPSVYKSSIGGIQIDADHLWLTLSEKRTISVEEDFRTNYGAQLKFVHRDRLMLGDDYARPYASLEDDEERPLNDIVIRASRPMYHELAHANDVIRPENLSGFSLELTPRQSVDLFPEQSVSSRMYSNPSMTVDLSYLYTLARIRFRDEEPEEFYTTILADFVGSEMGNEDKTVFYGYLTQEEDTATLFAKTMMKYHFDVDTHVGFANKPTSHPDASCNEYIVDWGTRNRLASPLVAPRARFVTEQMIGESESLSNFFDFGIGQESPLRVGDGWCDSRHSIASVASKEGITERNRRDAQLNGFEMMREQDAMIRHLLVE